MCRDAFCVCLVTAYLLQNKIFFSKYYVNGIIIMINVSMKWVQFPVATKNYGYNQYTLACTLKVVYNCCSDLWNYTCQCRMLILLWCSPTPQTTAWGRDVPITAGASAWHFLIVVGNSCVFTCLQIKVNIIIIMILV